ncbi:MAG: carbamate kinase [Anaerolineae bacterium]|nr:carbamate kinase [Anaerolineae bacterium]
MDDRKVAVVAIGGNSLIRDKNHRTVEDQYQAAHETCIHIASMIQQGWTVVISHGNGPQVGFILRRSELSALELHQVPLDACVADTQGALGYALQQNLQNEFRKRGMPHQAVTVVTQVQVAADDPAFQQMSKPIGSFMDQDTAIRHQERDHWHVVEDAGRGWRRVVPSPIPVRVVEQDVIQELSELGYIVIAVGGGGIPVVTDQNGDLKGVAAVIDKDRASSLLARDIQADLFLISTAVEQVYIHFGTPQQHPIDSMTVAQAKQYIQKGYFAAGSMLPKIEAIIDFLQAGGKQALITNPENIERALAGQTGTWVVP